MVLSRVCEYREKCVIFVCFPCTKVPAPARRRVSGCAKKGVIYANGTDLVEWHRLCQGHDPHSLQTEKDIDAYCAAIGLPREQFDDPRTKVDLPTTDRLYRRARELTGVDRVGLSLGPASNATMLGLVGHLLMSSPNLKTVLEGLGHYYDLFANTIVYRTFEKGPHVLHEMEPVPFWQEHYPFSCRQVIEHAFSTLLHVCSTLVKRPGGAPGHRVYLSPARRHYALRNVPQSPRPVRAARQPHHVSPRRHAAAPGGV
jgi:hypothetical protein